MDWSPEPLSPGYVVHGRYTIEAVIGLGGMGAVYRARHNQLGRILAIKVLHPHIARNPVMIQRFHREARAAGSIGHDNICEVTEFGATEDGLSYLVMPYLKGVSYSDVLVHEDLSLGRVIDIFVQMLGGLEAAHKAQIIHRDLKPENVLITQVGDRTDFVKLLDFGISKMLGDDEGASGLTRTGSVFGTPHYMAPEQARGSKNVDERADIYAVGVMLYETLTGNRPYQGDSWNAVMYNILNEPFPIPAALNPNIADSLNKVVLQALAQDSASRYQSASQMAEELEAVLEHAPDSEQIVSIRRSPKQRQLDPMPLFTTKVEFNRRISTTAGDDSEVWKPGPETGSSTANLRVGRTGTSVGRRWLIAALGLVLITICGFAVRALLTEGSEIEAPATVPVKTLPPVSALPSEKQLSPAVLTTYDLDEASGAPAPAELAVPAPASRKQIQKRLNPKTEDSRSAQHRKPRHGENSEASSSQAPKKEVIEGWSGSVFYTEY